MIKRFKFLVIIMFSVFMTISCSSSDSSGSKVKVDGVSLSDSNLFLSKGEAKQLTALVTPADAKNKKVTWSSSNESVVTVDANGLINTLTKGTAVITTVSDDGGYTASCEVAVKAWSHPQNISDNISPDGQNVYSPEVAMDDNGNAIVVWSQNDGVNDQIFMSEYRNGSWSHPATLADNISPDGQDAHEPNVCMDNNGNAIIVWSQNDGVNRQIFMSEYRNGSWSHPATLADNISPDGQNAGYGPQVCMDNNGIAIVAWEQQNGTNYMVYKSEYRNNTWVHPTNLATDNISPTGSGTDDDDIIIAMDNNSNVIITWRQDLNLFKSEYRNGAWTHPADINDYFNLAGSGEGASDSHVAMFDDGTAILAWEQRKGANDQIYIAEYKNGAWVFPVSLDENVSFDATRAGYSRLAQDNNGNAILVWRQYIGTDDQLFKSEYRNGAWSHPADITDDFTPDGENASYPSYPEVKLDNNGNAIIVWSQNDGVNRQIFMSEYRNGSWSHPASLAENISPDGQVASYPQVCMDNNGNAIVVWKQSDGTNDQVYISEYR